MTSIEERDRQRQTVLDAIYDATGAEPRIRTVRLDEVEESTGLDGPAVREAFGWLQGRGLAQSVGLGGTVSITHDGVDDVEERRRQPGPDLNGSAAVLLVVLSAEDLRRVEEATTAVEQLLNDDDIEFDDEARAEVEDSVRELTDYAKTKRPRRAVAATMARVARAALVQAAGGIVGNRADAALGALAALVGHLTEFG